MTRNLIALHVFFSLATAKFLTYFITVVLFPDEYHSTWDRLTIAIGSLVAYWAAALINRYILSR